MATSGSANSDLTITAVALRNATRLAATIEPRLAIRPNVQYVYTLGTVLANVNLLVFGLKTVINS